MKPLRVLLYPGHRDGCAHYRMLEPARVLADDPTVDVAVSWNPVATNPRGLKLSPTFELRTTADVVVMQRPMHQAFVESIAGLQKRGIAVVIEVDDDFTSLHRDHPSHEGMNHRLHPECNTRWLATACEIADHVTVSTPRLAAVYGSHGRVSVIRNTIAEKWLSMSPMSHKTNQGCRIGWTGSVSTHCGDLTDVGSDLQQIYSEHAMVSSKTLDPRFWVVGDGKNVAPELSLPDPLVRPTGWLDNLDEYMRAYATFNLAICPLIKSDFNDAKSWIKMLEAAALGVVPIGSPTPEYYEAGQLGLGFTVGTHGRPGPSWYEVITALVEDPVLRSRAAIRSQAVASELTIEKHAHLWRDAWAQARDFRSGVSRSRLDTRSTVTP